MTDLQDVHMGHKEGWAKLVNAAPRVQPRTPHRPQVRSPDPPPSKQSTTSETRDWHANMGVLRTPQLRGLHDTLWDIVDSNLHDNDRAKGAVAIDGAAGLGAKAPPSNSSPRNSTFARSPRTAPGPLRT